MTWGDWQLVYLASRWVLESEKEPICVLTCEAHVCTPRLGVRGRGGGGGGGRLWKGGGGTFQFCLLWSSPSCVSLTAVILILLVKSHNFSHQQKHKQQGNDKATGFSRSESRPLPRRRYVKQSEGLWTFRRKAMLIWFGSHWFLGTGRICCS